MNLPVFLFDFIPRRFSIFLPHHCANPDLTILALSSRYEIDCEIASFYNKHLTKIRIALILAEVTVPQATSLQMKTLRFSNSLNLWSGNSHMIRKLVCQYLGPPIPCQHVHRYRY
jgi:hypothetical protein